MEIFKKGGTKVSIKDKKIITNEDVISFYSAKKEHYPISDDFVKKYQQKNTGSNTYIVYALETGILVDKELAEPNQKWHLLESYFSQNIKKHKDENNEGYINETNTCASLKCPELLLWMAEAAGVDSNVIKSASEYAKKEIDYIRKNLSKAYSAKATIAMNKELRNLYSGKTLWYFIEEKFLEWKNSKSSKSET